jgi:NTE family protein
MPTIVTTDGVEKEIKTTDFGITQKESQALFKNGADAGQKFLKTWDFEAWKKKYRQNSA